MKTPFQNHEKVKHVVSYLKFLTYKKKNVCFTFFLCRHLVLKPSPFLALSSAFQISTGRSLCYSQCRKLVKSLQELKMSRYIMRLIILSIQLSLPLLYCDQIIPESFAMSFNVSILVCFLFFLLVGCFRGINVLDSEHTCCSYN